MEQQTKQTVFYNSDTDEEEETQPADKRETQGVEVMEGNSEEGDEGTDQPTRSSLKAGRGIKNSPASQRGRKEAHRQRQQTSKPASKSRKEVGERHTANNDIVNTEEEKEAPSAAVNLHESEVANCEVAKNSLGEEKKEDQVESQDQKQQKRVTNRWSQVYFKYEKEKKSARRVRAWQKLKRTWLI